MAGAENDIATLVIAGIIIVGSTAALKLMWPHIPTAREEHEQDLAHKRRERAQILRRVQENRRRKRLVQNIKRRGRAF